ncbi:NADPH-dependent ferric siderophore reductase [Wenyingzhuangia heitensis]|uniref:NADPH-dependent ferric siderophore reductase n=1 Tax=Wenyingzhuangia heitensis TaxID=1487859 RepID=A0ABX0UA82_9FLAO|nr:SIP domain-containing protein [Wenyingzhuangia heitensis]NIJ45638.1 NADPH-dependent ferric siderophore reductase [Wenyingzhuangia heitensis]
MGIIENILKKVVLQEATILEKTQLSSSVYKVKLQSKNITNTPFIPGSFLRLGIGIGKEDISFKDKIRSYSVWNINKKEGTLDLAIATHSNGIGAEWVKNCKIGELIYYKWKKGTFLVDNTADSYLMIGDLSALSHLYIINRSLASNKKVESIIYSQNKKDLFTDIDGTTPFNFYEMLQNPQEDILEKVKKITSKMNGKKMVYLAGDSRICLDLNQYFRKELQWDTKQIKTKPFWNPNKKGLE